jgi:predicted DsbA family dithiol-disulfide isomerase
MTIRETVLIVALTAANAVAAPQSNSKIVATVNGENVTEQQMMQAASADLTKLNANRPQPQAAYDRARLEILWKALNSIIDDKLIAAEAAKDHMTKAQLLEAEVESNVETPSPEGVDQFYEANKSEIPGPKAQALPQVRQYMIDSSRKRYRDMLMNNLRRNFKVTTFLDPLRTNIATAGYPSRGPAKAPITIVEFADFECPFCGGLFPTLKLVEKTYADRVRLVYRQFPLTSIHPLAQKAAEASLCANEQKHFWEFYDSMFGDQAHLDVPSLKKRAQALDLNTATFNTCLDSGKQVDAIQKDREDARKAGVSSTPTLFINGRLLSGNRPFADIREIIEDELKRTSQAGSAK